MDFLEKLKAWYNEPDIKNITFTPCDNGVYVRFKVGYRFVCEFEPY